MGDELTRSLPILMTDESVRAILARAKNQTRRILAPQPVLAERGSWLWSKGKRDAQWAPDVRNPESMLGHCRYRVGDELWVKEAWASNKPNFVAYAATGEAGTWASTNGGDRFWMHHGWISNQLSTLDKVGRFFTLAKYGGKWRSPMFMPRWAARLFLRVDWCRVERLQDVTEADAMAEGVGPMFTCDASFLRGAPITSPSTYRTGYRVAWDDINRERAPWDANPWVQVVGFTPLETDHEDEARS